MCLQNGCPRGCPFFLYVKKLVGWEKFCNNNIMAVKLMSVKYFSMLFFIRTFANEKGIIVAPYNATK